MNKRSIQRLFAVMGAIIGYQASDSIVPSILRFLAPQVKIEATGGIAIATMIAGAVVMYWVPVALTRFGARVLHPGESSLAQMPVQDLIPAVCGLIIGLIISVLLFPSLSNLSVAGWTLPFLLTVALGAAGFRLGYLKREELAALVFHKRGPASNNKTSKPMEVHKILDTSVIIDGRIADICKTGFIEGILVIPEFVLEELQHIADSPDLLKRNRGRRGLDILNKIQKELDVQVLIYEGDFEDISEVDSKLVKLAKLLRGKVITNDFNLNKVCELQGVSVLNINDLANAVKPVVLPGEEILVQVIKDGKEHGQGVAYLDDGTMIVVEGGRDFIGSTLDVMVTSVLQTSAGRMIFAKPKLLEKAL
jgi:uncharacterized protein YacL